MRQLDDDHWMLSAEPMSLLSEGKQGSGGETKSNGSRQRMTCAARCPDRRDYQSNAGLN
jgi:hypothetical protein